jgi:LuxR family maltose regulon positive regulatory protein
LIEARAFGTATVSADGKLISKADWDSASAKELFFFLLANPQGLGKDHILNALWGNISAAKASAIFHSTVYRIRHALSSNCLLYENGLYRINPELNLWYDVDAFHQLIAEAKRTRSRDSRTQLWLEAITLYRGDYFEDSYSDWSITLRTELLHIYLDALLALADDYAQESKIDQTVSIYQKILDKDNLHEDVYRMLMQMQFRSGDRGAALKTYQRCVQTMWEEMGIEPSLETRQLFEQISAVGRPS